ncbi:MAG: hypothetical protein U0871_03625 [Gemmataceae bacterium]
MLTRREFAGSLTAGLLPAPDSGFRLATFRADVTPPAGTPLCIGLVKPVASVSESLAATGFVLLGPGKPFILCGIDWCEIGNADHLLWRTKLADAAGTTADHVAVHCVHQHDAPWADTTATKLLEETMKPVKAHDPKWAGEALDRVAAAVRGSLADARPVTHVGTAAAVVSEVASNRRILGPDGKAKASRTSATRDPKVRAEPEGLIDPKLRALTFFNGSSRLATVYHYATHPMSHYGQGAVSRDFVGIARQQRADADGVPRIYLTGCAGNVTAGKYNDGSPANRAVLAERVQKAMAAADAGCEPVPLKTVHWNPKPLAVRPATEMVEARLLEACRDGNLAPVPRIRAAIKLSFLRQSATHPVPLGCLTLNDRIRLVSLPGEPFVEYQLFAQQTVGDGFVMATGYGDGGPGYLPLTASYAEGGYEPTMAFGDPNTERPLKDAIKSLLTG